MFTRYRMAASQAELRLKFTIVVIRDRDDSPAIELAPRDPAYVVRNWGGPILDVMSWGFPPADGRSGIHPTGNMLLPFWRSAIEQPDRRCLVPATQFCEQARGGEARWYRVASQPIFAFAGVWRRVLQGTVFSILTTPPNALLDGADAATMPWILHEKDHDLWLTGSGDEARALAQPYPSDMMAVE